MAKSPAWQRKEGKNPKGGLNAKGRASYKKQTGGTLKAPVKKGDNPRRGSFLSRMGASKGPDYDSKGKPTRKLLSLRAWGASSSADARKKQINFGKEQSEKGEIVMPGYGKKTSIMKSYGKKKPKGK